MRVASPSANVAARSVLRGARSRHVLYAAGAPSAWTPITVISGRSVFATSAAPDAPLPPPTGTMKTSVSGRSVNTSSAAVATPAMRYGSFPECT